MRVTNNLLSATVNEDIRKNFERIYNLQEKVSTGKRINKLSDDPIGTGQVLEFRKRIATIDQYGRNIQWGTTWLETTDSSLDSINTMLLRAKEVAVYQSTETATQATRDIAAEEMENVFDQVLQLANTSLGGRYIFSGQKTDTAPYSRDGDFNATYSGQSGDIRLIIGENVEMPINTNGDELFDDTVDIFAVLKGLRDGLAGNDTEAISDQIELLDDAMQQVQNERATVGARLNRLESTANHWETFKLNTQEMLSETEDVDLVTAMTELQAQQTAYQAALATAAQIIQPSLIDFLR